MDIDRIDQTKLEAFALRTVTDLTAGYTGVMVSLGSKLGLYKVMADAGPLSAREIAVRAGCAERTVTFFFTDHGEYLGDFGLVEKWPSGVDDVLVRNPLIVHVPDGRSGMAQTFVEMIDLTATLEDLAELAPVPHFGRSIVPVLDDPATAHRDAAFSEGGYTWRRMGRRPLCPSTFRHRCAPAS